MAGSILRIAIALALAAFAGQAMAARPSGVVLAVVQQATIDGATGKKVLFPEAPVYPGDRIQTDAAGSAQVRFRDNTKLVVGPNSSMVIDAFVFDNDNTARQISINVVKGAFRFITGNSRKDAYTIKTPTATIGVRGTEFDISIEREGTTRVASFEGTTRICRSGKNAAAGAGQPDNCVDVSEQCSLSVIRPTQNRVVRYSNDDVEFRNNQLKYYFPYVRDQSRLLQDFRVDLDPCHLASNVIRDQSPPRPDNPPNPVVTPPPTPPAPTPPSFTPPPAPSPANRHQQRSGYDHNGR